MYHDDSILSPDSIPRSLKQYERWLESKYKFQRSKQSQDYTTVVNQLSGTFRRSEFLQLFQARVGTLHWKYNDLHKVDLFTPMIERPDISEKLFNAYLDKTFRINFPRDRFGSITARGDQSPPEAMYDRVNDIVRTKLTVKYLDGVDCVMNFLEELCLELGLRKCAYYKSEEDGYYGAHFYVYFDILVYSSVKKVEQELRLSVEIQITTQLQEAIQKFHHDLYAANRSFGTREGKPWQWRYQSDEFFANYLGHILHNAEGMIMEVRRRQEARNAKV